VGEAVMAFDMVSKVSCIGKLCNAARRRRRTSAGVQM